MPASANSPARGVWAGRFSSACSCCGEAVRLLLPLSRRMKPAHYWIAVVALTCSQAWADCDLSKYRAQEGLTAAKQGDALLVAWEGDKAGRLRMVLAVDSGVPTVRELAVQGKG